MRDVKKYPIEYQKCTGCGVCVNICPVKAIEMSPEDNEGFKYPIINQNCIDCGRCEEICPQKNPIKSSQEKEAYAAFTLREEIRNQSSSGGIFYELARYVIDSGGVVCGAVYDENLYVKHKLVKNKEDIYALMVSKYMQSDMEDIYAQIAEELKTGKKLLFSGTPCQVHALKMYLDLMKIEGDLITIDLLCFGIPSPKAAHRWMEEVEKEYQKKIKYVTLKDKTYGWHSQKTKYIFEDDTSVIIKENEKDYFVRASFVNKFVIRRSCFECKYKTEDRVSDITIGDFWGIEDTEMDDDKGTSAVLIHSRKGRELFQILIDNGKIKYEKCKSDVVINGNPEAFNNRFIFDSKRREYFWKLLDSGSFPMAINLAEKWIGDMKNENRVQFINNISACDIILFGAGYKTRRFYNDYKYLFNIVMCVSNNPKEMECSFEDGNRLPVVRPSEAFAQKTKNTFIIICVDNDTEIEKQLISYGMTAGEDYIHYGILELLMTRKKIAILYGVCYMRPLCHCLKKSAEFSQEYEVFYWLSYKGMTEVEHAMFLCLLKVCDLYLYNPSISRQERALEEGYLSHLPERCVRVKLPSVGAEAYHPQTIRPEHGGKVYNVVDAQSAYGPFTGQDWYINQMIDDGKCLDEIKKAIKDENFLTSDFVRENYEIQIRKMELQESASDIKICDYLISNHKKKRLFLDGAHIANDPICEIANRLLDRLGYAAEEYTEEADDILIYASEVPVYPAVIERLQLSVYQTEELQYKLFTFHGYQSVTFDEYIERYYDYCKHMKCYIERGYFV